jgi:hypothetical protein
MPTSFATIGYAAFGTVLYSPLHWTLTVFELGRIESCTSAPGRWSLIRLPKSITIKWPLLANGVEKVATGWLEAAREDWGSVPLNPAAIAPADASVSS